MPNFLESQQRIDKAISARRKSWASLTEKEAQLAEKITILVELAGGRDKAAEAMLVAPTSVDNYRKGKTAPNILELMRLLEAAGQPLEYVEPNQSPDAFAPESIHGVNSSESPLSGLQQLPSFAKAAEAFVPGPSSGPTVFVAFIPEIFDLIIRVRAEASSKLNGHQVMGEATKWAIELIDMAKDIHNIDELRSFLPWIEGQVRREISAARKEPGTGKRSA